MAVDGFTHNSFSSDRSLQKCIDYQRHAPHFWNMQFSKSECPWSPDETLPRKDRSFQQRPPGTPQSKKSSTITLRKLQAFDNVLSPTSYSKKSIFLQDVMKDSACSIDSVPSKPVRRGSQLGSTHNARLPARSNQPQTAINHPSVVSSETSNSDSSLAIVTPQERKSNRIFFSKDTVRLRKTLEEAEALFVDDSPLVLSDDSSNIDECHFGNQDTRWKSSFVDDSSLRVKQLSSEIGMPSMPRRTTSSEGKGVRALP